MPHILNRQAVKEWLSGQRIAAARIEAERVSFLLSLTPDHALQIYLDLSQYQREEPPKVPSPVLLAMRRALSRLKEADRG